MWKYAQRVTKARLLSVKFRKSPNLLCSRVTDLHPQDTSAHEISLSPVTDPFAACAPYMPRLRRVCLLSLNLNENVLLFSAWRSKSPPGGMSVDAVSPCVVNEYIRDSYYRITGSSVAGRH